ncbi:hypothetical protein BOX15_Mlig031539g2, partial [Macrostomum lignano]
FGGGVRCFSKTVFNSVLDGFLFVRQQGKQLNFWKLPLTKMGLRKQPLALLALLLCWAVSTAAATEGSSHYHDHDGDGKAEHDSAYDQEQFLGKDMAKQFSQLDSSVSEEKLQQLIKEEVDADKDGFVSEDELLKHLEKVHKEQQTEELDTQWKEMNPKNGKMDWETHVKTLQPGFLDEERDDEMSQAAKKAMEEAKTGVEAVSVQVPEKGTEDERESLREFFKEIIRQRKRWNAADADKDGFINQEEYRSLLFPEDSPSMREIVADETISQLDTDRDGRINQDEYLAGQWTPSKPGEKEPHWLQEERDGFAKKDTNSDGFLDKEEVQNWLQPPGAVGGHSLQEEARHLMREADENRDGRLSPEEISKHRDLFAGSRATRYGEDVFDGEGGHDEL